MNNVINDNNNNKEPSLEECNESDSDFSSMLSERDIHMCSGFPGCQDDDEEDDPGPAEDAGKFGEPSQHVLWSTLPGCIIGNRFVFESQLSSVLTKCNKNGQTPMCYACMHGCLDVVRYFAHISEDMNARDTEGNTPLMLAAQAGQVDVLRYLLWNAKDLDIDAVNATGMTALMKCALRGRSQCSRMLIVAGADVEKRDFSRNFNAYEWAMLCGFKKTAKVIHAVGSAGPLHIQRTTTSPRKQGKLAVARNMYSNVKDTLSSKFKKRPENWVNDVGSLFYLVESTIRPDNLMQPLAWGDFSKIEEGTSPSVYELENGLRKETPPPTIRTPSSDDEMEKEFRKNLEKSPLRKNSRRYDHKDVPLIFCTHSSPEMQRKTKSKSKKENESDKNLLQLPRKKGKSLK